MERRPARTLAAAGMLGSLLLGPWLLGGVTVAAAQEAAVAPGRVDTGVRLSSGALRDAVARVDGGRSPAPGIDAVGGRLRVEVLHSLPAAEARAAVVAAGGVIEGEVPGVLVQATVPAGELERLEQRPGIDQLRPPLDVSASLAQATTAPGPSAAAAAAQVVGEEVAKTNAGAWHAVGLDGTGVRVGIVDFFSSSSWNASQSAGEVPAPAGTFCRNNGASCDVWANPVNHGLAVAEIVHEMAPGAALFLATVETTSDLQAAVDWFAGQGVRIISRSLGQAYDGPGNGTGPLATVVNSAVSKGMAWFNSAGNTAGGAGNPGSYWRGPWIDADDDGWLEFAPGDEVLTFDCAFLSGLRWSDWGTNRTDYDVRIYDDASLHVLEGQGTDDQGGGAAPLEHPTCEQDFAGDIDYLLVEFFSAGSGTAGDVLELMSYGSGLERWQNAFSATQPIADSNSPGALAVGAIDPPTGTTIGKYSSQGPTNDGRIKPDLTAAACVASHAYAPACFDGTSSATPAAAGAAALVIVSGRATTPATVKTYLLNSATVDRGAAGADNVYGKGELRLPAPPTGNRPPLAVAGSDATVSKDAAFDLDASQSPDPDGNPLTYLWTQVSGPAATIQNPRSARTRVNALGTTGTAVFRVTVTDSVGAASTDEVRIKAK